MSLFTCGGAYDVAYSRSTSGLLKISCLISELIGLLCIMFSSVGIGNARGSFYIAISIFGLISTLAILGARLCQLWQRKFYNFNVVKYEMYLHAFLALAFFLAACFALSLDVATYSVAAFFGFLAFLFYAHDAYLSYHLSRKCDVATQTQCV